MSSTVGIHERDEATSQLAWSDTGVVHTTRKLLALLDRDHRRRLYFVFGLAAVAGLMQLANLGALAPFLQMLIDPSSTTTNPVLSTAASFAAVEDDRTLTMVAGGVVVAALVATNIVRALTLWMTQHFLRETERDLSTQLLERYLALDYEQFLGRNSAVLSKTVLREVTQATTNGLGKIVNLVTSGTTAVAILAFLVWYEPLLSLGTFVLLGGAYALVFVAIRRQLARVGKEIVETNSTRYRMVNESLGGFKEMKLGALEATFVARYREPADRLSRATVASQVLPAMPHFALEVIAFGGLLLVLLALLAREQEIGAIIPIAGVFAFATYRLLPSVKEMFGAMASIKISGPVVDVVYGDMTELEERDGTVVSSQPEATIELTDELRLEDVWYTYPEANQPSLRDAQLTIKRGQVVGVVGLTGAGKTTLVDVVLGLLSPTKGRMVVDGRVVDQSNLRRWQASLGYVPQHGYLADDTVAANIAFGIPKSEVDSAKVQRAAEAARIHERVMDLPKGYETIVGERGTRLSGGERQRMVPSELRSR